MSATVPPNLPLPPNGAGSANTATSRGTDLSAPDSAALTRGLTLNARVVGSSSGQLTLSTDLGRVTLQTSVALPNGTVVSLQVQSGGPAPQVLLQFPQGAATPQPLDGSTPAPPGVSREAPPQVVTRFTQGSILQATVLGELGRGPDARAVPALASDGPAATANTATTAATGGSVQNSPALLTTGSNLFLRVLAFAPPGGTPGSSNPALPPSGPQAFSVTVTGHQPGGAAVVSGNGTTLLLQNASNLPLGGKLVLEVVKADAPPLPARAGAPAIFPGASWAALSEALETLHQLSPTLARSVTDVMVPTPSPRMTASMLFFLSAVFSGDVRRFLGADAMRLLNRGAGSIGERLTGEFGQLQRTATDAQGHDWRLFLIPMLADDGLGQVRFLMRDGSDGEGAGNEKTGIRFIIEVEMSRLGPFQFDALSRNKHVDLVVRTQKELEPAIRDEIRAIFGNTITALGFSGTVALRVVPEFPVSPVENSIDNRRDMTV